MVRQRPRLLWERRCERDKSERVRVLFLLGASGESLQSADVAGISPITVPTRPNGGNGFAALREEEQQRSGEKDRGGEEARTLRQLPCPLEPRPPLCPSSRAPSPPRSTCPPPCSSLYRTAH